MKEHLMKSSLRLCTCLDATVAFGVFTSAKDQKCK